MEKPNCRRWLLIVIWVFGATRGLAADVKLRNGIFEECHGIQRRAGTLLTSQPLYLDESRTDEQNKGRMRAFPNSLCFLLVFAAHALAGAPGNALPASSRSPEAALPLIAPPAARPPVPSLFDCAPRDAAPTLPAQTRFYLDGAKKTPGPMPPPNSGSRPAFTWSSRSSSKAGCI